MTESKLKEYHLIFTEAWRLFKKYSNMKNDANSWDALKNEIDDVRKRLGGAPFARDIMLAIYEEMGRVKKY